MEKGINTVIKETKDNITKAINNGLAIGLPIQAEQITWKDETSSESVTEGFVKTSPENKE